MDYYLLINDKQAGPYALDQLRSMWAGGGVTLDTLYWTEGTPEWRQLRTLTAELQAAAGAAPGEPPLRHQGAPRFRRRARGRVVLAAVLLVLLAAGGGFYFIRVKGGGRGGWSKAADAELRRGVREFVRAGVHLDAMSRQDTNTVSFGRQVEVAITAFELPSQSWPPHFAPQAKVEFEAAVAGWKLLRQIRQLHAGETYHSTNNLRLIAALEAYAPGRVEYDPDPERRGFIPFAPNIREVIAKASGHFTAGCAHLEKYYGE